LKVQGFKGKYAQGGRTVGMENWLVEEKVPPLARQDHPRDRDRAAAHGNPRGNGRLLANTGAVDLNDE